MRRRRVTSCTCAHGTQSETDWSTSPWLPTPTSRSVSALGARALACSGSWGRHLILGGCSPSPCLPCSPCPFFVSGPVSGCVSVSLCLVSCIPIDLSWDPCLCVSLCPSLSVSLTFSLWVSLCVPVLPCPSLSPWPCVCLHLCLPMSPCLSPRCHPVICWLHGLLHGHGPGGLVPVAVCGAAAVLGEPPPTGSAGQLRPGVGEPLPHPIPHRPHVT